MKNINDGPGSSMGKDLATLSTPQIEKCLESSDPFPVDLDDAWQWIGWYRKQQGKEVLIGNFIEGVDFLLKGVKSPTGGHPSQPAFTRHRAY